MQMSVVAAIGSNTCTNHAATTEDYELKPIDFLPYTIKSSKNTRYYYFRCGFLFAPGDICSR